MSHTSHSDATAQQIAATARVYETLKSAHKGDFQVEWPRVEEPVLSLWTGAGVTATNDHYWIRLERTTPRYDSVPEPETNSFRQKVDRVIFKVRGRYFAVGSNA